MPVQTRSTDEGFAYRNLNKNGRLDPYEDPRLPIEERVEDLLVSAAW
jgi:beta-glucosidase